MNKPKNAEEISEVFDNAVAERIARQQQKKNTTYLDGVITALGWALGEYEDSPID